MRASHYAHALHQLLREQPSKESELIKQTLKTVHENGHDHLLHKILRSFTRLEERSSKRHTIEVVTSAPISETDVQKILKKDPFKKILSADHKHVKRTVDDSIIGGVIVRTGAERVDTSYKRALIQLYQHITK